MQQHYTVLRKQIVALAKESSVAGEPDVLEHADGYDPLERTSDIPIVGQRKRQAVGHAGSYRALAGNGKLFFG